MGRTLDHCGRSPEEGLPPSGEDHSYAEHLRDARESSGGRKEYGN